MEVTLVHPDDPQAKVTVTHPIQVAAYKGQGFVEESELTTVATQPETTTGAPEVAEEVARLKAENKALKSENTKLKNKLDKTVPDSPEVAEGDEPESDDQNKDGSDQEKETE